MNAPMLAKLPGFGYSTDAAGAGIKAGLHRLGRTAGYALPFAKTAGDAGIV